MALRALEPALSRDGNAEPDDESTPQWLITISVVLIVIAVRWLLSDKSEESARVAQDGYLFPIKRQFRFAGLSVAAIFLAITLRFHTEWLSGTDEWLISVPAFFILLGIWIASGSVKTDNIGITKRVLGFARTFRWTEISELRFFEKNRNIEIRAGKRRLRIDFRFAGLQQLLSEVQEHTKLPVRVEH